MGFSPCNVARHKLSAAAMLPDFLGDVLKQSAAPCCQDNSCSVLGKHQCRGAANAGGCASNEGNLAIK